MSFTKPAPEGYRTLQPYLILQNAAEAIEFYRKAFGATERLRMPDASGRITHAEIVLGDSCIMLADEHPAIGAFSAQHYGGSPVSFMVYVDDVDSAFRQAVDAGAAAVREPADQPYGDRMAGVKDPFGYNWYLGTHIKNLGKEELENLMK
jgi:PhnB protein